MRRRELLWGLTGLTLACGGRRSGADTREALPEEPAGRSQGARSTTSGAGAGAGAGAGEQVSSLRVLTYNVLADEVALDRRMPALFRVMREARADLLALQEVAEWFLPWVADTPWLKDFHVAQINGQPARPNGQFILSRWPIASARARRLSGAQGRTVLVARIELGGGDQLALATTHMESYLEDGAIRAQQLDQIFAELAPERDDPQVSATVFCGDLNFGAGEQPDSAHLDPAYTDAWMSLHPEQPGYTWDIERSEMAARGSFPGEPSRRLDRVLVRGASWRSSSIEIVGDAPVIPGQRGLFPSDHFGLVAQLERSGP